MPTTFSILLSVLSLSLWAVFPGDTRDKEEIRKTLQFGGGTGPYRVVVDNIDGPIEVTGSDRQTVELVAIKTIKAESDEKLEEARREVTLEIKEEKNKIVLYVDAPWRTDTGVNYRGWHYHGYSVKYEFELKVPNKSSLVLKTVNKGGIVVKDVEGEFEVRNVNGGIEMVNVVGPAEVSTVNGPVKVEFGKNPSSDCSFRTINGKVEVKFHDGLSADLRFKTFNGHVYTDFDVTALPIETPSPAVKKGRKWVYRRHSWFGVRAGNGGPSFSFDTLNGSIYVLKDD